MLTEEQRAVVDAAATTLGTGERLKVVAGAGTGKTTVLEAIVDRFQTLNSRALVLAYNRAIMLEIRERFAGKADVSTLHGLAFRSMGVGRLKRRLGAMYPWSVTRALSIPEMLFGAKQGALARAVIETLRQFYASADTTITAQHIPLFAQRTLPAAGAEWVVDRSRELFEMAAPGAKTDLPLPHDLYLKAWQCAGSPGLERYDSVLLDEAQDANPVIVHALAGARHAVFVGDPNQQIYMFRGSVDAMNLVTGPTLPLTQSFRWGPEIARVANTILGHKQTPPQWALRGDPNQSSVLSALNPNDRHARIYRANNDLMQDALFLSYLHRNVALVGDRNDIARSLEDANALRNGRGNKVKHHLLRQFTTWEDAVQTADAGGSSAHVYELQQLVRLVEMYDTRLDDLIALLRQQQDESLADITLTTAHRAKGREWDKVVITQDFDRRFDKCKSDEDRDAELNLLYVAATRARRVLEIQSDTLLDYLATAA
jgi:superfamily I DNA/RNA helicase